MKITYVIDYLHSLNGGTEKQLFLLIKGMIELGHEVKLYVFRETEFTRNLHDFICPVYTLNIVSLFSLKSWIKLFKFRQKITKENVDVVHGFFNDVALSLPALMVNANIKTFTSRRDMGIWYTPGKLFILRIFKFSNVKLICNCIAVARLTEKKEWKNKELIKVIFNGIEISGDNIKRNKISKAQKKSGFKVVLMANVRPVKRIEDFVRAAYIITKSKIRLQFYVIGDLSNFKYVEFLKELLCQFHIEDQFHFIGPVSEPRRILSDYDLGVLTSESEGLSNTLMEYFYAELPAIASRVGGNPELISHGATGLLYEPGDVASLADCIIKLFFDSSLRMELSLNAKKSLNRFDKKIMIERHEMEYKNCLDG